MATTPTSAGFKRLIISALIVPAGLMVCIAAILVFQIDTLADTAESVEVLDRVIARANYVEKLTIDLETGLRGYLLIGDEDFLVPFTAARASIGRASASLGELLSDSPAQAARLAEIEALRAEWLAFADRTIASRQRRGDEYLQEVRARTGKRIMDAARLRFGEFIQAAESARDMRSLAARRASRITLFSVAGLTVLGGVTLSWLARRQFMELGRTYETALDRARDLNATLEQRVTERTREAEERSAQLTEANRELEAFSYSISHDLRAPMRHITGFADLLRRSLGKSLSPDDSENLTTIYDTARNAGRMVDDLLALSRIGRTSLRAADTDTDEIVRQVRRELDPETRDRRIEWRVAPLPPAHADPALLRMVFQNLIANAVKYTSKKPQATIVIGTVAAAVEETAEGAAEGGGNAQGDGRTVTYFVKDDGVGFDMAYADKLFGVFQRLHRAEEFEGTGIGLANVRRIIVRHGGRVWADATVGHGATFFFTLPAAGITTTSRDAT